MRADLPRGLASARARRAPARAALERGLTHVLEVRALRVDHGARTVVASVDLDVQPGQICALMGESGAGKTTVLRAILGLQPFQAGSIAVGDFTLRPGRLPPESQLRALRRRVGMVFQGASLFEHLNLLDNLTLAPMHALGWPRQQAEDVAHRLLGELGLATRAAAYPRQLSGGEAQRGAIARALALDPPLLLMDEPTSALDPARRASIGETLRELARSGRAILIATHDVEFVRVFADDVLVLAGGRVVERGQDDERGNG